MINMIPDIIIVNNITYEKYIPSLLHQFRENYTVMTFRKRLRFLFQTMHGTIIFYMKDGTNTVGYVVLEKGASVRYPFSSKNDWIISPYIIKPSERGKGYGSRLLIDLKSAIHPYLGGNIWAEVRVNNSASIKAMKKAGFEFVSYAKIKGPFRTYVIQNEESEYMLYRI